MIGHEEHLAGTDGLDEMFFDEDLVAADLETAAGYLVPISGGDLCSKLFAPGDRIKVTFPLLHC